MQSSLLSISSAASFNGVNLLNATASNANIVSSFSRGTDGTTSVGTITVVTSSTTLTSATAGSGILSATMAAVTIGGVATTLGTDLDRARPAPARTRRPIMPTACWASS